jgi:hypothetical protein
MADQKISQLTPITGANISDTEDLFVLADTSTVSNKSVTREELFKNVGSITTTGSASFGTTLTATTATFTDLTVGNVDGDGVQSNPTDTDTDKLMKVGAFGLGTEYLSSQTYRLADIDNLNTPTGFYGVGSGTTGDKPNDFGAVQVVPWYTTGTGISQVTQIFWPTFPTPEMHIRHYRDGSGWSEWREVYTQASVVGTVSQSGGEPTGAVIERGSNANGEYVRFADGTQICWQRTNFSADSTTAVGNMYSWASGQVWTFPAVFASNPNVSATGINYGGTSWGSVSTPTTTAVAVFCLSAIPLTNRAIRCVAVGRWF